VKLPKIIIKLVEIGNKILNCVHYINGRGGKFTKKFQHFRLYQPEIGYFYKKKKRFFSTARLKLTTKGLTIFFSSLSLT
jgi:hypothetical protein